MVLPAVMIATFMVLPAVMIATFMVLPAVMMIFFVSFTVTINIITISILCPYSKFIIAAFDHISIMTATQCYAITIKVVLPNWGSTLMMLTAFVIFSFIFVITVHGSHYFAKSLTWVHSIFHRLGENLLSLDFLLFKFLLSIFIPLTTIFFNILLSNFHCSLCRGIKS